MKLKLVAVFLLPLLSGTILAVAPSVTEDGNILTIGTLSGARALVSKDTGRIQLSTLGETTLRATGGRFPMLLEPVFSVQQMEKGGPALVWTTTVEKNGEDVSIRQTTMLDVKNAGIDLSGIRFSRTIVFSNASQIMHCKILIENITTSKRYVYFGLRNIFMISPDGQDYCYIPTTENVLDIGGGAFWGYYARVSPWQHDLTEGWLALNNRAMRRGLAFRFDYNTTDGAYVSDDSLVRGWLTDGGALKPGDIFETAVEIIPIKGLCNISHVAESYVAGFAGSGKEITLEVFAPDRNIEIKGALDVTAFDGKEIMKKIFSLPIQAGKVGSLAFATQEAPMCQTVVRVTGEKNFFEQYRENGFRTRSIPMQPPVFLYTRKAPPKSHKEEQSSDTNIMRAKKALVLFGLYTNFNRFDKILEGWEMQTISAIIEGIKDPPPASTIDDYCLIILGNVNKESMRGIMTRLISFVKNGGILLIAGGPLAYGCGGYDETPLNKLLPVQSAPFDLRPAAGDGRFDEPLKIISEGGKESETSPEVLWLHKVILRDNAKVLLRAGNLPVLVYGTYGKGKILCFLGAPMGKPANDSHPYWNSQEYIRLMRNAIEKTVVETK